MAYLIFTTTRNLLAVWTPVDCKHLVLMSWEIGV